MKHFRADPDFGAMRFKRIDTGFPRFDFDPGILDIVGAEEFMKTEYDRLPLFIGTQFGIYPRPEKVVGFYDENRLIAILGKS